MSSGSTLAEILRTQRETILATWSEHVRSATVAERLDEDRLRNSLPVLLDRVADEADDVANGTSKALPLEDLSRAHAHERLEHGYSVDELLVDYVTLREAIVEVIEAGGRVLSQEDWKLLNRAVDRALMSTMQHFLAARERKLRAFERLTTGIAENQALGPMLDALIEVFVESVPSVDATSILIAEGDRLVVRATHGLEREKERGFALRIGEGFSGRIAAERRPMLLREAYTDPLVLSRALRDKRVHALYGVPLVHDDEVIGVAHMASCTAYEFSEEDLLLFRGLTTQATSAIAQAKLVEQLRTAAHFREQLVGIVGHDLRTPLNAITVGASHLVSVEGMPEAGRRVAARIGRSADRMRRMVDQLLDFTRARLGGGIPLVRSRVRLDELARDVVGELEMAHPERAFRIAATGDTAGSWDPDRLRQMLTNLLENAVTHGKDPISLTLVGEDARVKIAVHNGGAPIPDDVLPEIFEPFRRGGASRVGLGLGLFIAKQIARAHGADLGVTSDERGTTFEAALPRAD